MSWEVNSIRNYWFFTKLRLTDYRSKSKQSHMTSFWLRLLNFFYLYFMHFWAIETRKYQTNSMISLYWWICIVFQSVSLGYFLRGLNTHSMLIYAIFLRLYRPNRFPNFACPYKICDIYNILTYLLAFLTHFGTYGQ
jgi:hypothetical protein